MTGTMSEETIAWAAGQISAGRLDPIDLTERYLARISAGNDFVRAFVDVDFDGARAAAARASRELRSGHHRGLLHGIPIAVKDIIDVAGRPTECGSRLRQGHIARHDAAVVERLRDAGAVLIGKASTYEFAFGSIEPDVPLALNPWDLARWTGASSSGSAAAVAARFALGAIGTDSAGSIRSPAAFCGLVGLKPSFGTVPLDGIEPLAPSLDHCGPMARSAADAALMLGAMTADPCVALDAGRARSPLAGLRLAVVRNFVEKGAVLDAAMVRAFEDALAVMRNLGATIHDTRLPDLAAYHRCCFAILINEARRHHADALRTQPELFGASLRARLTEGALRLPTGNTASERERLVAALTTALRDVDALVFPTSPGPAPLVANLTTLGFLDNPQLTAPASLAGVPAVSICCGFTPDKLPLGLQIVGALHRDRHILAIADAYQAETDWHLRSPT